MCWRIMMKKRRGTKVQYTYIYNTSWQLEVGICFVGILKFFVYFSLYIFRNTRVWMAATHTYKYHLIQQRQTKRLISLRLLHLHNRWDDNKSNLWRILCTTLFSNENENEKTQGEEKNHPELPQKKHSRIFKTLYVI